MPLECYLNLYEDRGRAGLCKEEGRKEVKREEYGGRVVGVW